MNREDWQEAFKTLGQAIRRLRESYDKAVTEQKDAEIYRDATIQRFEFTAELFWKVLKKLLSYEQIKVNTPREVLSQSYMAKLIDGEKVWLEVMVDRNLTSHTYKQALAREVFSRIGEYLPMFEKSYKKLKQRYEGV